MLELRLVGKDLRQVLDSYPYLFSNILWLAGLLLVVRLLPSSVHRRLVISLGLIMMPSFLFSPVLTPDYWSPVRVGGWTVGIEDALCSFNVGASAFLPAAFLFRDRLVPSRQSVPRIGHFLAAIAVGQALYFLLWFAGVSSMSALILTQSVAVVLLLLLCPHLWQFCLGNGVAFTLSYCAFLKVLFLIWPNFLACWRTAPPWGALLFGIPFGEVAGAASFGVFWFLFAGYIFDLRVAAFAGSASFAAFRRQPAR